MKKLFALLLVSTLLLSLFVFPVGVSAAGTETAETHVVDIGVDDETVSYGGKNYSVIRTASEFINMQQYVGASVANYTYVVLANDIDFNGVTLTPVSTTGNTNGYSVIGQGEKLHHLTLEGNGYTLKNVILNFSNDGSSLFPTSTYRTSTVRHITIEATCNITGKNCGVLYGHTTTNSTKTVSEYVTLDLKVDQVAQGFGGFIGLNQATSGATFTGCTVKGSADFSVDAVQNGGFIGRCTQSATFTNCSSALNITSYNNRKGGYIGSAEATISFTDCSATGTYYEMGSTSNGSKHLSGFVGGAWNANAKLTFSNCTSGVIINGSHQNGGFVGVMNDANATATFTDCTFNGTIFTALNAGGFVGEANAANVTINTSISSGKVVAARSGDAYAVSTNKTPNINIDASSEAANTASVTQYEETDNSERILSGEISYLLSEAQIAAGIPENRLYGLNIGVVEGAPEIGAPRVYKIDTKHSDAFYTNDYTGIEEVSGNEGKPAGSYQLKAGAADGTEDLRLILAIDAENLPLITSLSLNVQFGVVGGGTRKLTCDLGDVAIYWSVLGGDKVYEAADGYVLMAVVISDIPTAEWDRSVDVSLTVNAEAAEIYNYALNFDVAALAS